ncbi:hypothetical protein EB796_003079 [Bugula neritina]|uniref:Uncharacterized protein n=1 Tax=Bugula neritina TaxID=10212 RepID=A0A7J7KK57_BUGNE|nr:hypothetical protein EB796_003079 [Bugula neritina]
MNFLSISYNSSYPLQTLANLTLSNVVRETTTPEDKDCAKHLQGSDYVLAKLFGKSCASSSIPMGIGTGAVIFIIAIIVVHHFMKREKKKEALLDAEQSRKPAVPIPADCISLIYAEENSNHNSEQPTSLKIFSAPITLHLLTTLVLNFEKSKYV